MLFCKNKLENNCKECEICHKDSLTLIDVTEDAFGYPHYANRKIVELKEENGDIYVITTLSGSPDVSSTYYYKTKGLEDLVKVIQSNLNYASEKKQNENNEVFIYKGK